LKSVLFTLLLLIPLLVHAGKQPAELLKVEDGDTLLVNLDGNETRIQLQGIDAPEDSANPKLTVDMKRTGLGAEALLPLGEAATAHLRSLANTGSRLMLSGNLDAPDRYGRIPAEAFTAEGLSLNAAMVADGYARPLPTDAVPESLRERLQMVWTLVRDKKPGLWSAHPETFRAWAGVE